MTNKTTILLSGSILLILMLIVGCKETLSGEAAASGTAKIKAQAVTAAKTLSYYQLKSISTFYKQGEDPITSCKKITTAAKALAKISTTERAVIITTEIATRAMSLPPTSCSVDRECPTGFLCLYNPERISYSCLPGYTCWSYTPSIVCEGSEECIFAERSTNDVDGREGLCIDRTVPRSLGEACYSYGGSHANNLDDSSPRDIDHNTLCASGFCGWNGIAFVCEELNQPLGSPCNQWSIGLTLSNSDECASAFCGWNGAGFVCENRDQRAGAPCVNNDECESGSCYPLDGSGRCSGSIYR